MSAPSVSLSKLNAYIWSSVGALAVCVAAFALYALCEHSLRKAQEIRLQSLLLATELRQSSNDLTRMVRGYAATSQPQFRQYYQEILDIRDGRKPRPLEYENVYWDLVADTNVRPSPDGPHSAMLQRMEAAGFTQAEFNKLAEAKAKSDALVGIERAAMRLVEIEDGEAPEQVSTADRLAAVRMLHDADYLRGKAEIMHPIRELIRMVDDRTAGVVAVAERRALTTRWIFIAFGIIAVALLLQLRRSQLAVLGSSFEQLHAAISNAAAGDLSTIAGAREQGSIMGKLAELQSHRIDAERQHRESERALTEAEQRFRDVVTASGDGICVIQDALIRFANPKLCDIVGHGEAELIGRPFMELVHEEDRDELLDRYRKQLEEFAAGTAILFRVRRSDQRQPVVKGHAARFEWSGRPATLYFLKEVAAA